MGYKHTYWIYRIIKWIAWLIFPKFRLSGTENLPDEPCVIVGNHSQANGPVAAEIYSPGKHYTWCIGEMMHWKEVPSYSFQDFWSAKPKSVRWFYKLLSYLITPISVITFNNADTIPVYHDARLITTFRQSVERLQEGSSVVIFPECYEEHNNIVHGFQDKFVDLARFYYKKTGKELCFVPLYIAPRISLSCRCPDRRGTQTHLRGSDGWDYISGHSPSGAYCCALSEYCKKRLSKKYPSRGLSP